MDEIIEVAARAIEPELAKQEMLLADPLTLRRLMAKRAARAAIAAIMPAIGERMAREIESAPCDHGKPCFCAQCELNQAGQDIRALANTMAAEVGK